VLRGVGQPREGADGVPGGVAGLEQEAQERDALVRAELEADAALVGARTRGRDPVRRGRRLGLGVAVVGHHGAAGARRGPGRVRANQRDRRNHHRPRQQPRGRRPPELWSRHLKQIQTPFKNMIRNAS